MYDHLCACRHDKHALTKPRSTSKQSLNFEFMDYARCAIKYYSTYKIQQKNATDPHISEWKYCWMRSILISCSRFIHATDERLFKNVRFAIKITFKLIIIDFYVFVSQWRTFDVIEKLNSINSILVHSIIVFWVDIEDRGFPRSLNSHFSLQHTFTYISQWLCIFIDRWWMTNDQLEKAI